jgi:hypothetical protein
MAWQLLLILIDRAYPAQPINPMLQQPPPGGHLVPLDQLLAASRHRDARSHQHNHLPAGELPF